MSYRLKHAADFPISPLGNRDAVPTLGPLTTTHLNGAEMRRPITNMDPRKQSLLFLGCECPQNTHCVLSLQPEPGMHQVVGQLTRAGKQQQTFRIQVKAPDRLPFALKELGQPAKDGGPVLRVVMGHHFTRWFVVGDDPGCWRLNSESNRSSIDFDLIPKLDSLTNMRRLIVHADAAFKN
jgi:hypothetical protein